MLTRQLFRSSCRQWWQRMPQPADVRVPPNKAAACVSPGVSPSVTWRTCATGHAPNSCHALGRAAAAESSFDELDALLNTEDRRKSTTHADEARRRSTKGGNRYKASPSGASSAVATVTGRASNIAKNVWGSFVGAMDIASPIDRNARAVAAAEQGHKKRAARRRRKKSNSSQGYSDALEQVRGQAVARRVIARCGAYLGVVYV